MASATISSVSPGSTSKVPMPIVGTSTPRTFFVNGTGMTLNAVCPSGTWRKRAQSAVVGSGVTLTGNTGVVDGQVLQFRLRGGSDAVPAARGVLDRLAEEYELPSHGDLRLLISELVTNTVVHAETGPDDWV